MNEHVAAPLDVAKIREDFPVLALKPYGKTLVYLDNAASAQKPRQVVDRMVHATYTRIFQCPPRPALSRQCRDRGL